MRTDKPEHQHTVIKMRGAEAIQAIVTTEAISAELAQVCSHKRGIILLMAAFAACHGRTGICHAFTMTRLAGQRIAISHRRMRGQRKASRLVWKIHQRSHSKVRGRALMLRVTAATSHIRLLCLRHSVQRIRHLQICGNGSVAIQAALRHRDAAPRRSVTEQAIAAAVCMRSNAAQAHRADLGIQVAGAKHTPPAQRQQRSNHHHSEQRSQQTGAGKTA